MSNKKDSLGDRMKGELIWQLKFQMKLNIRL